MTSSPSSSSLKFTLIGVVAPPTMLNAKSSRPCGTVFLIILMEPSFTLVNVHIVVIPGSTSMSVAACWPNVQLKDLSQDTLVNTQPGSLSSLSSAV